MRDSYQDRGAAPDCAFNGNSLMNRESRAQNGGSAIATARCAKLRSTRDSSINVDAFKFSFHSRCSITKAKVSTCNPDPSIPSPVQNCKNLLLNWSLPLRVVYGRPELGFVCSCLLLLLHFDPFAISSLPDRLVCTLEAIKLSPGPCCKTTI